jgi:hypothetical protein
MALHDKSMTQTDQPPVPTVTILKALIPQTDAPWRQYRRAPQSNRESDDG